MTSALRNFPPSVVDNARIGPTGVQARTQNLNMIPVYLLAISLVWSVRPASVAAVIQRMLDRASALPVERRPESQRITRVVRVVGIVMSVISLIMVQMAVHAAMAHRPH